MNILILGMPNVGKTSLYNILSNDNKNIIHPQPPTIDTHVFEQSNMKNTAIVVYKDAPKEEY